MATAICPSRSHNIIIHGSETRFSIYDFLNQPIALKSASP